jgi:hypothetical protein
MKMKPAVCEKCGKKLDGFVPEDATDIICFACNEGRGVNERPRTIVRGGGARRAERHQV